MATNLRPGGTEGGDASFLAAVGFLLSGTGLYFLFDSINVRGDGPGIISGSLHGAPGMGGWSTASMGVIFVPFFLGVAALFYDSSRRWAWGLFWGGLAIIAVEVLSRVRFEFGMKTTQLLIILGLIAAGAGLMMKAYRNGGAGGEPPAV